MKKNIAKKITSFTHGIRCCACYRIVDVIILHVDHRGTPATYMQDIMEIGRVKYKPWAKKSIWICRYIHYKIYCSNRNIFAGGFSLQNHGLSTYRYSYSCDFCEKSRMEHYLSLVKVVSKPNLSRSRMTEVQKL